MSTARTGPDRLRFSCSCSRAETRWAPITPEPMRLCMGAPPPGDRQPEARVRPAATARSERSGGDAASPRLSSRPRPACHQELRLLALLDPRSLGGRAQRYGGQAGPPDRAPTGRAALPPHRVRLGLTAIRPHQPPGPACPASPLRLVRQGLCHRSGPRDRTSPMPSTSRGLGAPGFLDRRGIRRTTLIKVTSAPDPAPIARSEAPGLLTAIGNGIAIMADHACEHHLCAERRDADHRSPETCVADQASSYAPAVLPADVGGVAMVVPRPADHPPAPEPGTADDGPHRLGTVRASGQAPPPLSPPQIRRRDGRPSLGCG